MKVLYIWEGSNPLPKHRIEAINKTYSLYPAADFYWVTNGEVPFPWMKRIDWNSEKEKMREFFGLAECPKGWDHWMNFSDWFRFYWLINNPNGLFLDTDCAVREWFDFEAAGCVVYPFQEIFLLYAPKDNAFAQLKARLDKYVERGIFGPLLAVSYNVKKLPGSMMLPELYYKHK